MGQILNSTEFWAALIGGGLSLLGSYLSLRWQSNAAKRDRADLYKAFYFDSLNYISHIIKDLEIIWDKEGYASFQHLDQIERVLNAVDRHMDGFAIIEDKTLQNSLRRFFFELFGDVNFLRFAENKRDEARKKYNSCDDKNSAEAREAQASFLEANNVITKRISNIKSKSTDLIPMTTGQ